MKNEWMKTEAERTVWHLRAKLSELRKEDADFALVVSLLLPLTEAIVLVFQLHILICGLEQLCTIHRPSAPQFIYFFHTGFFFVTLLIQLSAHK